MSDRFFVAQPIVAEQAVLTGSEAHHLVHVMRGKVGDIVILFDGSGCEFTARVDRIAKTLVGVTILEHQAINRELGTRITLAVALPKSERQRWLIEKAVELGVAALIPLSTQRSVAKPSVSTLEKLRRTVVEASKQCGRNRFLEIAPPCSWDEVATKAVSTSMRLLAHPGGMPLRGVWTSGQTQPANEEVIAAIGPEGGFADEEVARGIAAGWVTVDLGPRILRIETAAIALAAWAALNSSSEIIEPASG